MGTRVNHEKGRPEHREGSGSHKHSGRGLYVGAIVGDLVLVFVLNSLSGWNPAFLTPSYASCLWVLNVSLGAAILANCLFLFWDKGWFRHLCRFFLAVMGFASLVTIYMVFPFNITSGNWEPLVRVFLVGGMVGLAAGCIVEGARLALRRP